VENLATFGGLADAELDHLVAGDPLDRPSLEHDPPDTGRSRPETVRNVVDLPAPLDPIKVTISPA
jgi:hypothetical protein